MLKRFICLILILAIIVLPFYTFAQEPHVLVPREKPFPIFIIYLLLFSAILIATAKFIKANLFTSLSKIVLQNHTLTQSIKDGLSPISFGGVLLLINYFLMLFIGFYLILNFYQLPFLLLYLIPVYFFFVLLCFYIVGVATGNLKYLTENIQNHFFFHQFLGLILLPLLIVWVLNYQFTAILTVIFISLNLVNQLYRWIRGGVFALKNGVRWYYFILYFCTLEILPVVAIYRYLG